MHQPTWWGHPRGVFLVAFTELWERFSYWGLAGLLVLYLTAAPAAGGWGWENADAVQFYGWYGGLAFALPVVGGWLANNYLGERRCILWGGVAITTGHAMLAAPVVVADQGLAHSLFLFGLLLIVLGTGLLKPTISSIVAQLYPGGDARRDEGFSLFFVAIYIGAMLGALVTGYLGERVGWHWGLGAAGIGMAFGLACYIAGQQAWLGDIGRNAVKQRVAREPLTQEQKDRMFVLLVQGAFTVLYACGFYQMFGLLNLYARDNLDRTIGNFELPTTWLQTINLIAFFVFVPTLSWVWRKLAARQSNPSASWKLAMGLASLAVGYAVLFAGEGTRGEHMPHVTWMIAAYVLFGLGDALVWANQMSLTSKLAPPSWTVAFVGGWYVCIGIGTWLTGYVGKIAAPHPHDSVFVGLGLGCLAAAALLCVLTPMLKKRMHGAEHLEVSPANGS
jgi:POT family proton-dependent oligopeptide transporter